MQIKSLQYKHILQDISFEAEAGDIIALVGRSGAGKTSLLRLISGMYSPTSGYIFTSGNIGFVYQNAFDALSPSRTILSQMRESTDIENAHSILQDLGIGAYAHTYPALMSGGQQMRAMIAMNIAMNSHLLLLDEATANLDDDNTHMILEWVKSYVKKTKAIVVWATHDMRVVSRVANKVLHMENGQVIYQGKTHAYLKSLSADVDLHPVDNLDKGLVVAQLDNVSVSYGKTKVLEGVSLQLHKGEIVGLYGASGRGKTTILRTLLGQVPVQSGMVKTCAHMQMIFQDAKNAFNPTWSIYTSLLEAVPDDVKHKKQCVEDMVHQVGISPHRLGDKPSAFSGGECQRLSIARAFLSRPQMILADEMTSALDIQNRTEILKLLQNLQSTYGVCVLFVSHNKAVLDSVCNRIIKL